MTNFFKSNDVELEALGIVNEAMENAVRAAFKEVGEDLTSRTFDQMLSEIANLVIGDALSAAGGAFLSTVVVQIIKRTDNDSRRLKSLFDRDYKFGSRVIQEALDVSVRTVADKLRRDERLKFGIERLELSLELSADVPIKSVFICKLVALSEMKLDGGLPFAAIRLEQARQLLKPMLSDNEERLRRFGGETRSYPEPTVATIFPEFGPVSNTDRYRSMGLTDNSKMEADLRKQEKSLQRALDTVTVLQQEIATARKINTHE